MLVPQTLIAPHASVLQAIDDNFDKLWGI